jgi:hypothetical protein
MGKMKRNAVDLPCTDELVYIGGPFARSPLPRKSGRPASNLRIMEVRIKGSGNIEADYVWSSGACNLTGTMEIPYVRSDGDGLGGLVGEICTLCEDIFHQIRKTRE